MDSNCNSTSTCPINRRDVNTRTGVEGSESNICPVKRESTETPTSSVPNTINTTGATTSEQEIRAIQSQKTLNFYNNLRQEYQSIELHMLESEQDVIRKEEDAFFLMRFEHELQRMQIIHAAEIRDRKAVFEKLIQTTNTRQKAKRAQKQLFRDIKKRDSTITDQEEAAKAMEKIQEQLSDRSKMFEQQIAFVEAKHEKQRKQTLAAQERKLNAEKTLHDLETKHLKSELRSTLAKNFQARINHQKALDKRIMDHQRELQLLELRHLKERADIEETSFEEIQSLKISHSSRVIETQGQQLTELHGEKDRLYELRQQFKRAALEAVYLADMKKLTQSHRIQVRQMRLAHAQTMKQRKNEARNIGKDAKSESVISITGGHASAPTNQPVSQTARSRFSSESPAPKHSGMIPLEQSSRQVSIGSMSQFGEDEDKNSESGTGTETSSIYGANSGGENSNAVNSAGIAQRFSRSSRQQPQLQSNNIVQEDQNENTSPEIIALQDSITKMQIRHKDDLNMLLKSQKEESEKLVQQWQTKKTELEAQQSAEMTRVKDSQAREIADMVAAQEREIQMEAVVHDAEMKMLLERRLLNAVLNTVVDAIITIDPVGTIKRFNHAAELMFGYSASEVIEQNIRDLMPERFSVNHDTYLKNYLTTGVKKVIGSGRRAYGLRKDRSTFPIHLSISEVKDDSVHLFTGIVRDMTNEVEIEEIKIATENQMQIELAQLEKELKESKSKAQQLLSSVLPATISHEYLGSGGKLSTPPKYYETCTILTFTIAGFNILSSTIPAATVVEMLNDLHKLIEDVIAQYDAYRVESVGNKFTIVSGLPNLNGNAHSGIIATLAFHLMSEVGNYKIVNDSEEIRVQLRMAINTGPVTAGVISLKTPKYYIFGDTLDTANRLELAGGCKTLQSITGLDLND
ncbi:hypothetical protein HK098_004509 [Nowakowskiella sp. JEL0407]|nr:hypothetical protein HK098_004509 [Nowakowskiella sp. JEL0407]